MRISTRLVARGRARVQAGAKVNRGYGTQVQPIKHVLQVLHGGNAHDLLQLPDQLQRGPQQQQHLEACPNKVARALVHASG